MKISVRFTMSFRLWMAASFTILSLSQYAPAITIKNKPINWTKAVTTYSKVKSWNQYVEIMFANLPEDYRKDIVSEWNQMDLAKERMPGFKIVDDTLVITFSGQTLTFTGTTHPEGWAKLRINGQEAEIKWQSAKDDILVLQNILNKKSVLWPFLLPEARAAGLATLVMAILILGGVSAAAYMMVKEIAVDKDFLNRVKKFELESYSCDRSVESGLKMQMKVAGPTAQNLEYNSTSTSFAQLKTGSLLYGIDEAEAQRFEVQDGKILNFPSTKSDIVKLAELAIACCNLEGCHNKVTAVISKDPLPTRPSSSGSYGADAAQEKTVNGNR